MTTASEPITAVTPQTAAVAAAGAVPAAPLPDAPADAVSPPATASAEPAAAEPAAAEPAEPVLTPADLLALPDGTTAVDSDKWTNPDDWKYDWLDYRGDRLAVRIPKMNAIRSVMNTPHFRPEARNAHIASFWLKTGKDGTKTANHISVESFERVNSRMQDADDVEYADVPAEFEGDAFSEIMKILFDLGAERIKRDAEALAEVVS